MKIAALPIFLLTLAAQSSASPIGEWLVEDHEAQIAIRACGANLCGAISRSDDRADIGKAILIDMKPEGERWKGTIVDPRSNTKYVAYIGLQGEKTLKVEGCVLGGLFCGGQTWTRVH